MESTQPPQPSHNPFNANVPEAPQIVFSTESQAEELPGTVIASALAEAGVEIDTTNTQTGEDVGDQPNSQQEIVLTAEDIAFGELLSEQFAEHHSKIIWYLIRKTGTVRENAEDAVQLAFEAAWKNRANFDSGAVYTRWLYMLAFHRLKDEWRRKDSANTIATDKLPEYLYKDDTGYVDTRLAILECIDGLPARQKMVAECLLKDMSYQQIGDELNISHITARTTSFNVRTAMNKIAQEQGWR